MNTYYIYKGAKDAYFGEYYVAGFGDTIEVEGVVLFNTSLKNKKTTVTSEWLENFLKDCEEFDYSTGIDDDTELSSDTPTANQVVRFYELNKETIDRLIALGVLKLSSDSCRDYNVGKSNYSQHVIQPWAIWQDYDLNPWDADIVKRILRTKTEEGMSETDSRVLDYEKIIHICQERVRQLKE